MRTLVVESAGVSGPLASWLRLLQTTGHLSASQWLFGMCVGSKSAQMLMITANAMLLLAAARGSSIKEAAAGTLMCCGFYSCNSAHAVYLLRRDRARAILTRLLRVAFTIEAEACELAEAELQRAHRSIRWATALQLSYMASMVASVWVHVLVGGRPYAPMWPPPPLPAPWAERVVGGFEMVAMLVGCLAYFTLITLFGCLVIALTGLYRALGVRLKAARGQSEIMRVVRLHQQLNQDARSVELFFVDVIAHLMVAILVVPLVATLQVMFNVVDPLTFMSSSILVSVFLPMSIVSQDMTDSSRAMSWSAYCSAFNEEAPSRTERPSAWTWDSSESSTPRPGHQLRSLYGGRGASGAAGPDVATLRALALVMVAAARPARISLRGLGYVSLSSARKALRIWYQWGNMLVSVTTSS